MMGTTRMAVCLIRAVTAYLNLLTGYSRLDPNPVERFLVQASLMSLALWYA